MNPRILWIVLAVVVIAAVALAVSFLMRRRRTTELKTRFGPEYGRAVRQSGDARRAEQALEERARRVEKLEIRPLSPEDSRRFAAAWADLQKRFVDEPERSVGAADVLVRDAMTARGYPMADFERRAEDISVHYPNVVQNYRSARAVAERARTHEATTEDLRQALVHYRSLFDELLESPEQAKRRMG
jgi:hypothetical protein